MATESMSLPLVFLFVGYSGHCGKACRLTSGASHFSVFFRCCVGDLFGCPRPVPAHNNNAVQLSPKVFNDHTLVKHLAKDVNPDLILVFEQDPKYLVFECFFDAAFRAVSVQIASAT